MSVPFPSAAPRVVGLDLSLTSTGVSDGRSVHAFQTGPGAPVEARMNQLLFDVRSFVLSPTQWTDGAPEGRKADLVVLEGAAYGAKGGAVDQLAGLRWLVRWQLWRMGVPTAVVAPSALKRYTTGTGNATKAGMVKAVQDRHGIDLMVHTVKAGRSDMADAFALAAMGYAWFHAPLPTTGDVPPRPDLKFVIPSVCEGDAPPAAADPLRTRNV